MARQCVVHTVLCCHAFISMKRWMVFTLPKKPETRACKETHQTWLESHPTRLYVHRAKWAV